MKIDAKYEELVQARKKLVRELEAAVGIKANSITESIEDLIQKIVAMEVDRRY